MRTRYGAISISDSTATRVGDSLTLFKPMSPRFDVAGIGTLEHKIVAGDHVVDHVQNGLDGLLQAPREVAVHKTV
jgi:hypothetical protein